MNFLIFWENTDQSDGHLIQDVDYTHHQIYNGESFLSTIDHFVSNDALYNKVVEAGVIHTGENPSNHSPIFVKLVLDNIDDSNEKVQIKKRVEWNKSTTDAKEA